MKNKIKTLMTVVAAREPVMREKTQDFFLKHKGLVYAVICCMMFLTASAPHLYAAPEPSEMVDRIVKIVTTLVSIVGVLFIIIGIVKLVIAHANESGPEQQKAILMLASGIALALLGAATSFLNLGDWITDNIG